MAKTTFINKYFKLFLSKKFVNLDKDKRKITFIYTSSIYCIQIFLSTYMYIATLIKNFILKNSY